MRVSSEFYKIASKLLYTNAIVKGTNGMAKVLAEHRASADDDTLPSKSTLLSTVQQLTILDHTCRRSACDADSLPDIRTLLIIPPADCKRAKWFCNRISCPIISSNSRPEKVVFHNSRRNYNWRSVGYEETAFWPLGVHMLDLKCSTLTLVIDDAKPAGPICHRYQLERYEGIEGGNGGYPNQSGADIVRVVVLSKTPARIDKFAQRAPCTCPVADAYVLATHVLAQIVRNIEGVNIYIFRDFDPDSGFLDELDEDLQLELGDMYSGFDFEATYSLETLADYISEGVEDELLPEELQYWREENERRLKRDKGTVSHDLA